MTRLLMMATLVVGEAIVRWFRRACYWAAGIDSRDPSEPQYLRDHEELPVWDFDLAKVPAPLYTVMPALFIWPGYPRSLTGVLVIAALSVFEPTGLGIVIGMVGVTPFAARVFMAQSRMLVRFELDAARAQQERELSQRAAAEAKLQRVRWLLGSAEFEAAAKVAESIEDPELAFAAADMVMIATKEKMT